MTAPESVTPVAPPAPVAPPVAPPVSPAPAGPPAPAPIIIDTTADQPEEMIELFRLDGVSYQIPKAPRVAYAMRMLDDITEHGAGVANMAMLRRLIGRDAYDALASYDRLTKHQLDLVSTAAMAHTLSGVEDVTGN
jgi:hypothetical protein